MLEGGRGVEDNKRIKDKWRGEIGVRIFALRGINEREGSGLLRKN